MTFLPIVARELRVAARKRSTFWVRIVGAFVAVVIGAGFFAVVASVGRFTGISNNGNALFRTLTWLGLAATLSAGLFLTSDCVSEEKREGTLGFLFLTNRVFPSPKQRIGPARLIRVLFFHFNCSHTFRR